MMEAATKCKSCSQEVTDKYCVSCGEEVDEQISLSQLWGDTLEELQLEKGIFRTLGLLAIRPRQMIEEYLNGRTKVHMDPLSLNLLMFVINVLVLQVFNTEVLFEDGFMYLVTLWLCFMLIFQNKVFFFRNPTSFFQHAVVVLYQFGFASFISVLFTAFEYLIFKPLYGVPLSENHLLTFGGLTIMFFYFVFIPFSYFKAKRLKKILLVLPYLFFTLLWVGLGIMVIVENYPDRNIFGFTNDAKKIVLINSCSNKVEMSLSYQRTDGGGDNISGYQVGPHDTLILKYNGEPLLTRVPTIYFYAHNDTSNIEWDGDHPRLFGKTELATREYEMGTLDSTSYYFEITCPHYEERIAREKALASLKENWILGMSLVAADTSKQKPGVTIDKVYKDFPADSIGLIKGDKILQLDTVLVYDFRQILPLVQSKQNQPLEIIIEREGEEKKLEIQAIYYEGE